MHSPYRRLTAILLLAPPVVCAAMALIDPAAREIDPLGRYGKLADKALVGL